MLIEVSSAIMCSRGTPTSPTLGGRSQIGFANAKASIVYSAIPIDSSSQ